MRLCKLIFGLPSSGKRYRAEKDLWLQYEGFRRHIANNDLEYNFDTYNRNDYEVVFIWNPSWIYDSATLQDMLNDASINGYTIEKEFFDNDTVTTTCNAYNRWVEKARDLKYYEFINKFITDYSRDYQFKLEQESKAKGDAECLEGRCYEPVFVTVPVYSLAAYAEPIEGIDPILQPVEGGCKGGGGELPKPICLKIKC